MNPTTTPQTALSLFMEDITKLKPILTTTAANDEQGHLVWNLTPTSEFTVKSTYKFLNNPDIPKPNLQKIWSLPLHPKIRFFLWLLMLNKLQTAQNLQRKGCPDHNGVHHVLHTRPRISGPSVHSLRDGQGTHQPSTGQPTPT
jgi:zinc-binding in reverse transcriptase